MELPYSKPHLDTLRSQVERTFGSGWLTGSAADPLRRWWQSSDPWDTIAICRIGRDVARLKARRDAQQDARLQELVEQQIKKDRRQAEDYLYELHVAMMFDEQRDCLGELAPPGEPGYDLTVALSHDRKLWVSCKRLGRSQQEQAFQARAHSLFADLTAIANRYHRVHYNAIVATSLPLPDADVAELLAAWDRLCSAATPAPGDWISDVGTGHVIALTASFLASAPNLDMSTVSRVAYVQFIGALHQAEHERVRRTFRQAVEKLRRAGVPTPSQSDIQIVAMNVPDFTSITAVASLLRREFGSHYRDVTGALLTRSLHAIVPGTIQRYAIAEEYYFVPNERAAIPLEGFLGTDVLALLSEGPPLLGGPPVLQSISGVRATLPDGYLYSESDIIMRLPDGRIGSLNIPSLTMLLNPGDVPPADTETPISLP